MTTEKWMHVITQSHPNNVLKQIHQCHPYFTGIRYCDGEKPSETQQLIKTLRRELKINVEWHYRKWDDDYAAQDNLLLDKAKNSPWILIMDDDEYPSQPMLDNLNSEIEKATSLGKDMISLPSLLELDGKLTMPVEDLVEQILNGTADPFRKLWLFKHSKNVRSFGTPHRQVKRRSDVKGVGGNYVYRADWKVYHSPYPFIHTKTSYEFAMNDCLHSFINPAASGYTDSEALQMYQLLPKFKTSRELRAWLENPLTEFPSSLLAWAASFKDAHGRAIRQWHPILTRSPNFNV